MGFLCNTTFIVVETEHLWWKEWIHSIFIPAIKNMLPTTARQELYRVYDAPVEGGEPAQTFSLQWHVESLNDVKTINTFSDELFKQLKGREEKILHFSSVMKQLN